MEPPASPPQRHLVAVWFADVVGGRFPDTGAFLAGSIAWVKQKQQTASS